MTSLASGWEAWKERQADIVKRPHGGTQSPISPGFGMVGPPGNTPSWAPTGPKDRQSGRPAMFGPGPTESKYSDGRTLPPNYISDVNMEANWYSPFQPIWPYGPPYLTTPREWDYPVGYNLNYIPERIQMMEMFRGMRNSWGVLATIIETRKDQLLRIPYKFQVKGKPKASSVGIRDMEDFFRKPDKKIRYSQWARKLLDDLFVIDQPTIYFENDRRGRPLAAEVLDGATIFPLIDDAGRRPDSVVDVTPDGMTYLRRQPAYQQIIKGLPMDNYDEWEIMQVPMRLRPNLPIFGFPPTEQIFIEASEAIRKTLYQLNFWQEGNIPDLIVNVPETWTPRQIAMFQAHFDAMFSGNTALKSKVRFLPGGMKPFDVKNSSGESLWSQRDETLIRLACYAYSVSPTPFIRQTNRATAQNAAQTAEEEGLYPLMSYWKDDIMDVIIQEHHGYDDIEHVFQPMPEPDAEKQAKIFDMAVKNGTHTRNEIREQLGMEPIPGGDIATIEIGNQVVPVEAASKGQGMAMLAPPDGGGSPTPKKPGGPTPQNSPQRGEQSHGPLAGTPAGVAKITTAELDSANAGARGDLDAMSHQQLHAGNYPKGHVWIHGLDVTIENAPGSKRGEKDQHGTQWEVTMPSSYGYIRGTVGADGMQLDCYVGTDPESDTVWVIDQNRVSKKGNRKGFDEHKAMLCYADLESALEDYLKSHFDGLGHERLNKVVELSWPEFKEWVKNGDLKAPIADQDFGEVVLKHKDLSKVGDTISTATNLQSYDQSTTAVPRRKKRRRRSLDRGPRWRELVA